MSIPGEIVRALPRSTTVLEETTHGLRMRSELDRRQHVVFSRGLLRPENPILRDSVGGRDCLVVASATVYELYGGPLRRYLESFEGRVRLEVLECSERTKTMDAVMLVRHWASQASLNRTSPIVAVGGGVCTDICGLAASLHRRGVPHIKIPTTLIGLIDAGIGTKNGVNVDGKKSAVGTFSPPEYSLLDRDFLRTLDLRHLRCGLAESVKMAVVCSAPLFHVLERSACELLRTGFESPKHDADRLIRLSVEEMLSQLAANLFESFDYRRRVDFGHTFSPHLEAASGYELHHGEAVAIDIALSTMIAREIGRIGAEETERILALLERCGLPLHWSPLASEALWSSLEDVRLHRNGDLHLVVPTGIGTCEFVGSEDLGEELLVRCCGRLEERVASRAGGSCGSGFHTESRDEPA